MKKRVITLFIFIIVELTQSVFGIEPDSIEEALKSTNDIRKKIELSIKLSKQFWTVSTNKAAYYGHTAYNMAIIQHNDTLATRALLYLAAAKYYAGEYDSCILFSQEAIKISPTGKLIATQSFAYNLISLSYKNIADLKSALHYAFKSFNIRRKINDTTNIAGSYDNIAHLYREMGKYEQAMNYSLKALYLFQKIYDSLETAKTYAGIANLYLEMDDFSNSYRNFVKAKEFLSDKRNKLTFADVHFNLGIILLKKRRFDSAMFYFNKSLDTYEEIGISEGIAESYHNIGLCYSGNKDYKKAKYYFYRAKEQFIKIKSIKGDIDVISALGEVYIKEHKYDSAEYYLKKVLLASKNLKYNYGIKTALNALTSLYEKEGSLRSIHYYKRYVAFTDSLEGIEIKMKLAELQTRYKTSIKEKKILKLELEKKNQKTKNQKLLFILFFAVLLFSFIIVFGLIKRKAERRLLIQQRTIAQKDKELAKMELNEAQLKTSHLEKELSYKIKQLTIHSLNMMQKSMLLKEICNIINEALKSDNAKQSKILQSLKARVSHILKSEEDWHLFKIYFENINKTFVSNLKKLNPNLTETEIRLAVLTKMSMTIKEIASILNVSPQSVKNGKYRLKKKLNIPPTQTLTLFIEKLN